MRIAFAAGIALAAVALGQPAGKDRPRPPVAQPSGPVQDAQQRERNTLVRNTLGFVIQKGTEQGLDTVEGESRSGGWTILDGETALRPDQLGHAGLDRRLRIDRFAPARGTVVVQIVVSPKERDEAFSRAWSDADKSKPPVLIDTLGRTYQPVGFISKTSDLVRVRFTRGKPIVALSELPSVSRNTPERELTLVYTVSAGAEVASFRIGDTVLETYQPTLKCEGNQP